MENTVGLFRTGSSSSSGFQHTSSNWVREAYYSDEEKEYSKEFDKSWERSGEEEVDADDVEDIKRQLQNCKAAECDFREGTMCGYESKGFSRKALSLFQRKLRVLRLRARKRVHRRHKRNDKSNGKSKSKGSKSKSKRSKSKSKGSKSQSEETESRRWSKSEQHIEKSELIEVIENNPKLMKLIQSMDADPDEPRHFVRGQIPARWSMAQSTLATRLTNVTSSYEFIHATLRRDEAAVLSTEVDFEEETEIKFRLVRSGQDAKFSFCCDNRDTCLYESDRKSKESKGSKSKSEETESMSESFRGIYQMTASCPSGTTEIFFLCENGGNQPVVCGIELVEIIVDRDLTCKEVLREATGFVDDYINLDELGDYGGTGYNERRDDDDEVDKMLEQLLMDD